MYFGKPKMLCLTSMKALSAVFRFDRYLFSEYVVLDIFVCRSSVCRPNKSSDSYYYEYIRKVLSAAQLSGLIVVCFLQSDVLVCQSDEVFWITLYIRYIIIIVYIRFLSANIQSFGPPSNILVFLEKLNKSNKK